MPLPPEPTDQFLRNRRGRPTLSVEHKRRTNAERQRRFRVARAAELRELRQLRPAVRAPREMPPSRRPPAVPPDIVLDLQSLP